jgi:hypothetical protein
VISFFTRPPFFVGENHAAMSQPDSRRMIFMPFHLQSVRDATEKTKVWARLSRTPVPLRTGLTVLLAPVPACYCGWDACIRERKAASALCPQRGSPVSCQYFACIRM